MNPIHSHAIPPSHWVPALPPDNVPSSSFWEAKNFHYRLRELQDTLKLAEAMQKELEMLAMTKCSKESMLDNCGLSKYLEDRKMNFECQESRSLEASYAVMAKLRGELEPYKSILDDRCPWEEKSAGVRLANKMHKYKRNKLWWKKKRKRVAESLAKEREEFDEADRKADEWRAREIAKDTAKIKVEKMKEIAKLNAKEERRRLESELELVLTVEKLAELQSIRIQKLKKQGHFFPAEDDKFIDRVRAAVEEEEQQAMAIADTKTTNTSIALAQESRTTINNDPDPISENIDRGNDDGGIKESSEACGTSSTAASGKEIEEKVSLPMDIYHYYHGSNYDMGTLIEVRRTWDAYIRPGGSRIPGHWIQPPPPADEIWESYLVRSK